MCGAQDLVKEELSSRHWGHCAEEGVAIMGLILEKNWASGTEENQHQEEVQAEAEPADGHSCNYRARSYQDPRKVPSASCSQHGTPALRTRVVSAGTGSLVTRTDIPGKL